MKTITTISALLMICACSTTEIKTETVDTTFVSVDTVAIDSTIHIAIDTIIK